MLVVLPQVNSARKNMKEARGGISTVAELAAHKLREAEKLERRPAFDAIDAFHSRP